MLAAMCQYLYRSSVVRRYDQRKIYRLAYSSYAIVDIAIREAPRIRHHAGDILNDHPSSAMKCSLGRVVRRRGLGVYGELVEDGGPRDSARFDGVEGTFKRGRIGQRGS